MTSKLKFCKKVLGLNYLFLNFGQSNHVYSTILILSTFPQLGLFKIIFKLAAKAALNFSHSEKDTD
jgi:hypothetical protein